VIDWDAQQIAAAAGARLAAAGGARQAAPGSAPNAGSVGKQPLGPSRVVIDSRRVGPGDLFVGLRGLREDGGAHAEAALAAGAWGVLVAPEHAQRLAEDSGSAGRGVVLEHPDPLAAMQALARAWREELGSRGARVVAITGSTGKTSTKDILAAILAQQLRTVASPENLNTEIGLPLAILAAPAGTEVLVLELAMRGPGQIAELVEIAKPEVGVIVNIGPVHLELLGSLEAIAAAKAELIAGMALGGTVVIPAAEPLLAPHLRAGMRVITFGEGGEVELDEQRPDGEIVVRDGSRRIGLRPSFAQLHNLRNLLAATAAAGALGVTPEGRLEVTFSALRGERIELSEGIVLINDCYNANPMSMRAAIDDLALSAPARRVAVLGDMLELGPEGLRLHHEIAAHADAREVGLLVTVGPLAAAMADCFEHGEIHSVPDAAAAAALLPGLLRPADTVLVKGSRGVGLELLAETLAAVTQPAAAAPRDSTPASNALPASAAAPARGN
jgi:UDP-N-acetylmuramoyl-tripeptide--D-alanyl-D-alanine ligase